MERAVCTLSGSQPGALAGFGDRKVIPGIPGSLEEKDLEISPAERLILASFFFVFLADIGSYGTEQLSVTCGSMQFTQTHLVCGSK